MFTVLAYFGPEVSLPLASGIVAVLGFVLMMGRSCFHFVGGRIRGVARRFGSTDLQVGQGRSARKIGALVVLESPPPVAQISDRENPIGH